MDTAFIFSIFLAIIFIIIALEFDEGMMLFCLGMIAAGITININTIFGIANTDYQGFGQLIQLIYGAVTVFTFGRIYYTAQASGIDMMFGRVRKHG